MKMPYQRTVFVIVVASAAFMLVRSLARSGDPLADVRATERQIKLANGAAPSRSIDWVDLAVMILRRERDSAKLWQKLEIQMKAHVVHGDMVHFEVPLAISSVSSTNRQMASGQLHGAALACFPEGCWIYQLRSNSFLITAPAHTSNRWVQLITDLQTQK